MIARLVAAPVFLLLAVALASFPVAAQLPAPTSPADGAAKSQPANTKPDWSELSADQKVALGPLASAWAGISVAQKRKWIALSQNYPSLSAAERATLHGRMRDWAALSPAERNQARLNFAQTQNLPAEEKKAQWEAYQALSPEQKKELASGAQAPKTGAARTVTPIAPNKLASVPITRSDASNPTGAVSGPQAGRSAAVRPKPANAASAPVAQP